jgi:hypothetical protein
VNDIGFKCDEELSTFLCCSLSAIKKNDIGLYVSRYNATYSNFNKENQNYGKISWYKIKKMFNTLEQSGYIENYIGYNNRTLNEKMSSCVVFTDKYLSLFDSNLLNKHSKSIKHDNAVVRAEENGKKVDIKNVFGIQKRRDEIKEIEIWLNTNTFKFITITKPIELQRVFIDDLKSAGRIYFGGLQCIEKYKRPLYQINDNKVSEYDFDSNHMFICAELEKVKLPEDFKPYDVDMSDLLKCGNPKQIRSILKMCCMFLLNSGTPEATFKKFWKKNIDIITEAINDGDYKKAESNLFYKVSGLKNTKEIIKRLESHNNYAKNYFRIKGGCWAELQNIDSEILLCVMKRMKSENQPFLPYHDSILVYKDNDKVMGFMKDAWCEVLGSNHNCRVSKKF